MGGSVRLSELCEAIVDCPHSTPQWTHAGPIVLRNQNIRNGRLDLSEPSYTNEQHFAERTRRATPRAGDLVITREAPMGEVCMIPPGLCCCLGQRMVLLRPNPASVEPRYLLYTLQSNSVQREIRASEGTGSTVSNLRIPLLEALPIPYRPLLEQRAIAHILGTLDDKIELNRRMNETLEAMARAVFTSWFVDATQAGLPKGWHEGKVEELLTLSRETINPSDFPDETFDHYSIPAFDEGRLPKAEAGEQIQSNKFLVPPGAVMISKLNPRIPRVWLPNVSAKHRSVASTEFLIAIPNPCISREWLYALFSSEAFLDVFSTLVTGTSGSHQRVKPEYLLAMDLEIPLKEHIAEYTAVTKPLRVHFAVNLEESRTLAALRDTLLPKLISGELRVKDAERIAGEVS